MKTQRQTLPPYDKKLFRSRLSLAYTLETTIIDIIVRKTRLVDIKMMQITKTLTTRSRLCVVYGFGASAYILKFIHYIHS